MAGGDLGVLGDRGEGWAGGFFFGLSSWFSGWVLRFSGWLPSKKGTHHVAAGFFFVKGPG